MSEKFNGPQSHQKDTLQATSGEVICDHARSSRDHAATAKTKTRKRVSRYRERKAAGVRFVRGLSLEVMPGIIVREIEVHDVEAEEWLKANGSLRNIDCDDESVVNDHIKAALVTRYFATEGKG